MRKNLVIAMALVGMVFSAQAEEQTTTAEPTENVIKMDASEATPKKDIDDEITNARMRATLGSKNKWSFKSAFGFSGGSIERPMAEVRPNYRAGASRESLPGLAGTVGINYRASERDNVSFSTGITIIDPFHGGITKPATDGRSGNKGAVVSRYQVATPSLDWSRGYKAFGTQMISGMAYSHYTDSDSADINAIGDVSFSQTVLANLGTSKWSGGLSGVLSQSIYGGSIKNADLVGDYESGKYKRDETLLAVYPFAEYSFTEKVSFRTVFGYFEFSKYKDEFGNNTTFRQVEPYQSMGVGFSVTRDIYLYPNVQFAPKDVRADRTNVALSANINI